MCIINGYVRCNMGINSLLQSGVECICMHIHTYSTLEFTTKGATQLLRNSAGDSGGLVYSALLRPTEKLPTKEVRGIPCNNNKIPSHIFCT